MCVKCTTRRVWPYRFRIARDTRRYNTCALQSVSENAMLIMHMTCSLVHNNRTQITVLICRRENKYQVQCGNTWTKLCRGHRHAPRIKKTLSVNVQQLRRDYLSVQRHAAFTRSMVYCINFRDKIILLHTSTQTRVTPVAKHVLYCAASCCMGSQHNTNLDGV